MIASDKKEVISMLFRKKIERSCTYCLYSTKLDEETILCSKKGIRSAELPCRKFKYAPCKRVPVKEKALDFSKYETEDFSL